MSKSFVAVRSAYYKNNNMTLNRTKKKKEKDKKTGKTVTKSYVVSKNYKGAEELISHIQRTGYCSNNVYDEFTSNNRLILADGTSSIEDAYLTSKNDYRDAQKNKRGCRSDMNTLFENVLVFSEEKITELENKYGKDKLKNHLCKLIKEHALRESEATGMRFCGGNLHMDEGHYNKDGTFIRNVHAHIVFFNYDFDKKISPLKNLKILGKDKETGKTNELNPHFVAMQDRMHLSFKKLGFVRGISKTITKKEHKTKKEYLTDLIDKLEIRVDNIKTLFTAWFNSFNDKDASTPLCAAKIAKDAGNWVIKKKDDIERIERELKATDLEKITTKIKP